jgi:glycyl-tRNA synthetase
MEDKLSKVMNFAKRYGFFYPSSEIYGGKAGFYDYGSIGTLLKRKFENLWKNYFGRLFDNIWEIEPCEIMPEKVFIASKHLEQFNDPITECSKGHRYRADKLIEEKLGIKADTLTIEEMNKIFEERKVVCPDCGSKLSEVRMFNLMFPIFVGPESGNVFLYLNEIREHYEKLNKLFNKISKDPTYETSDGLEFIAILKEMFPEKLYYIEKNGVFYLFDENLQYILVHDVFNNVARFYLPEKPDIEKIIEKYEDVDVEKSYEDILNKARPYLKYSEEELENLVNKLIDSYLEALDNRMFLRPETAQGPYVNFPIEIKIHRNKLPLGLMVVGRAFRNEISPRQGLLRLREFTQAELQIFFDYEQWLNEFERQFSWNEIKNKKLYLLPVSYRDKGDVFAKSVEEWEKELKLPKFYLYFMYKVQEFYTKLLGIPEGCLRFYELDEDEKSFYNRYHFDVEVKLEGLGWIEVGGIHFRAIELTKEQVEKVKSKKVKKVLKDILGNNESVLVGYDLYNHLVLSEDLSFIITKPDGKKVLPVELELSFGVDRNILALIWLFYTEDRVNGETREILKLKPSLAPIEVAVFPLLENREELVNKAKEVYNKLKGKFRCVYDGSGSIGKRYRRQDGIGTPFCITIDYQTLEDDTVTIRFRDSMEQIRVKISEIENKLSSFFE